MNAHAYGPHDPDTEPTYPEVTVWQSPRKKGHPRIKSTVRIDPKVTELRRQINALAHEQATARAADESLPGDVATSPDDDVPTCG